MSLPTDVEISRALNALSCTFREQRPEAFDPRRAEQILQGALAHEPKLEVRTIDASSGEVRIRDDGTPVALVQLQQGRWAVERKLRAGASSWAPRQQRG